MSSFRQPHQHVSSSHHRIVRIQSAPVSQTGSGLASRHVKVSIAMQRAFGSRVTSVRGAGAPMAAPRGTQAPPLGRGGLVRRASGAAELGTGAYAPCAPTAAPQIDTDLLQHACRLPLCAPRSAPADTPPPARARPTSDAGGPRVHEPRAGQCDAGLRQDAPQPPRGLRHRQGRQGGGRWGRRGREGARRRAGAQARALCCLLCLDPGERPRVLGAPMRCASTVAARGAAAAAGQTCVPRLALAGYPCPPTARWWVRATTPRRGSPTQRSGRSGRQVGRGRAAVGPGATQAHGSMGWHHAAHRA